MNKNISIGVLVAVAAVFGLLAFKSPSVVTVTKTDVQTVEVPSLKGFSVPAPVVNVAAPKVSVNVPEQNTKLSSITGPDIYSPYVNYNGVTKFYDKKPLSTATTTPCIYRVMATSSIEQASLRVDTSTSTATTWRLVYNPTVPGLYAGASSTAIQSGGGSTVSFSLPSGASGVMSYSASTTSFSTGVVGTSGVFPTGSYLMWEIAGIGLPSDTTKLNGSCQFEMRGF